MKPKLHILNSREVRVIVEKLEEQYGCTLKLDYVFLKNQDDRIFIIGRDVELIDYDELRINTLGLYFGEISKNGEVRLTIEGSQMIGMHAQKNVVELPVEHVRAYFQGKEIELSLDIKGQPFVLLKYRTDFFGAAKYKDGTILNYLPKVHRTTELMI